MQIFIMRHGHAVTVADSDKQRQLSEKGADEVTKMAHFLQQRVPVIDKAWVSPYLRTQQTWHILQRILCVNEMKTQSELQPEGKVEIVLEKLATVVQQNDQSAVLLVSHLPLVGYLLAQLSGSYSLVNFPTASIAAVTWQNDGKPAICQWFQSPALVRG